MGNLIGRLLMVLVGFVLALLGLIVYIHSNDHALLGILLSWFPMLLLIAVWIFFMRQMQGGKGGAMGFGIAREQT